MLKRLRLLLAEDNRADVMLVRQALAEHQIQHELHLVTDGEQALEFIAKMDNSGGLPCPDIVLLDLNLPKVDGIQVLGEIRKRPELAAIPVIVVTSSDAPTDRSRVAQLRVRHYFRKPSDYEEFIKLGALVREVAQSLGHVL